MTRFPDPLSRLLLMRFSSFLSVPKPTTLNSMNRYLFLRIAFVATITLFFSSPSYAWTTSKNTYKQFENVTDYCSLCPTHNAVAKCFKQECTCAEGCVFLFVSSLNHVRVRVVRFLSFPHNVELMDRTSYFPCSFFDRRKADGTVLLCDQSRVLTSSDTPD